MRGHKKGHGVLSRLTAKREQALMDYCQTHTLAEAVTWLAKGRVKITAGPLSTWLGAARLRAQLRRNEATVNTLMRELALSGSGWTPEQIEQAGQMFFSALALDQQDVKVWEAARGLALRREHLDLARAKFKESSRVRLEEGLDAVAEAFKGNAEALRLYQEARKLIGTETAISQE